SGSVPLRRCSASSMRIERSMAESAECSSRMMRMVACVIRCNLGGSWAPMFIFATSTCIAPNQGAASRACRQWKLIQLQRKDRAMAMYQRILVPVDGSSTSRRGLDEAIHLAGMSHGRLRLCHVIDELSFALAMDAYSGYAGNWLEALREE